MCFYEYFLCKQDYWCGWTAVLLKKSTNSYDTWRHYHKYIKILMTSYHKNWNSTLGCLHYIQIARTGNPNDLCSRSCTCSWICFDFFEFVKNSVVSIMSNTNICNVEETFAYLLTNFFWWKCTWRRCSKMVYKKQLKLVCTKQL